MPLGREVGLDPSNIVLDGDSAPLSRRGQSLPFSAHAYCGQTARWINRPLGTEVGIDPGDIVLDGDPANPKKGGQPQFSAHVYCGQTAGCIRIPLGTEVGVSPGDIVINGDQAPPSPQKGEQPHLIFGPYLLWPNGWMDEDATGYCSRPRPRPHSVRLGPSSLCERGTAAPSFGRMSIMATVAHLRYC